MPLILPPAMTALPLIEPESSPETMLAAEALIRAEMLPEQTSALHPSLPPIRKSKPSDLIEQEYTRLGAGLPKDADTGIDLSRYDAPEAPAHGSDKESWSAALRQAYASAEYLRGREVNLGLLETFGKTAWLVSNSNLEDELRSLERDVEAAKLELEETEQARRAVQGNAAGEMRGLEESWRTGVGRMIEAQAAGERLRQEVLGRRRAGAT
ncbi:hypothetical protein BAUCODRAFT_276941 [Baudoinia panamericana UAMH 10762]|uniref:Pre-mRNA-splicing factor SPF27 n=1 Tax=Baudoinia panamericana (strain UAMH 10762) TaxID=717646 RepID=M2LDS1_BAUPA|nr:uncharacterized protein BAUCODRAFT_276941 [Baudoinia panamericana UAMH 10762]EMC92127.1 hypothetical protein BAUCODRAFT_276941 [Baudoinia panamericana UAMH 10762]